MPNTELKHTVRSFDEEMTELSGKIVFMGGLAEQLVADAVDALVRRDVDLASDVLKRDEQIDGLEEEIDQQVIRMLALRQPMAIDLRMIAMALKISNDLERLGDYAVSIAKRAQRLADQPELQAFHTLPIMAGAALRMVKEVLDAFTERDAARAMAVWQRDAEVDQLYNSLFRELITYMLEDPRKISVCIDLLFIAKNLERIGDHATNIAEKVNYMINGTQINRPRHDAA